MNQFSSTQSSAGLLKDSYGEPDSVLANALKKKREALARGRGIELNEDKEKERSDAE